MVAVDDCMSPADIVFELLSIEDDHGKFCFYLRVSTFSIGQRTENVSDWLIVL